MLIRYELNNININIDRHTDMKRSFFCFLFFYKNFETQVLSDKFETECY